MVDDFCLTLNEISGIDLGPENLFDSPSLPVAVTQELFIGDCPLGLLIVAGDQVPGLIQTQDDGIQSLPLEGPLEYLTDHWSCIRVNDELVAVIRRFQIPISGRPRPEWKAAHSPA